MLHAHDDTLWNAQTLYRQMTNHRTHSLQRHDAWLKTQRTTQPLTVITTWQRSRWLRPEKRRRIVLDSCRGIRRVGCGKLARTFYFVLTFVACVLQAVSSARAEETIQDPCSASRRRKHSININFRLQTILRPITMNEAVKHSTAADWRLRGTQWLAHGCVLPVVALVDRCEHRDGPTGA